MLRSQSRFLQWETSLALQYRVAGIGVAENDRVFVNRATAP